MRTTTQSAQDFGLSPWACKGMDGETFFPTSPDAFQIAASTCDLCLSRSECLREGLATRADGVWGGQMLREGRIIDGRFVGVAGRRPGTVNRTKKRAS